MKDVDVPWKLFRGECSPLRVWVVGCGCVGVWLVCGKAESSSSILCSSFSLLFSLVLSPLPSTSKIGIHTLPNVNPTIFCTLAYVQSKPLPCVERVDWQKILLHYRIVSQTMAGKDVLILYGSQTGNSEDIAKDLHDKCSTANISSVCKNLNSVKKVELKEIAKFVVVVCSTTGNGDTPENADAWWRSIKLRSAVSFGRSK